MLVGAEQTTPIADDCARIIFWDGQHLVVERGSKWASSHRKGNLAGTFTKVDHIEEILKKMKNSKKARSRCAVVARWDGQDVSILSISGLLIDRAEMSLNVFGA